VNDPNDSNAPNAPNDLNAPNALLVLDIEKPAAGGRMLARHHGRVVLVSGVIPGERVVARLERARKDVAFAEAVDVLSASADRRPVTGDARCGGNLFAHIRYARQLQLKGEIIQDALGRIGRVAMATAPDVIGSPEQGYRTRARLHVRDGRIGFYREGTHQLCDAAATGQFLPATAAWLGHAQEILLKTQLGGASAIEIAESVAGDERACHLELRLGTRVEPFARLANGLVGLSAQRADRSEVVQLTGKSAVTDLVRVGDDPSQTLRVEHDVRAFFQGNRFLLEPLVRLVVGLVPPGPVLDLYAGVGLFGLALAATGRDGVTMVEADVISAADLQRNAVPFGGSVTVVHRGVEVFVGTAKARDARDATLIVDPPRTGLSREALSGIVGVRPPRIVYVSCDVATLARDARVFIDAGYRLDEIRGIDLFPNTAHVETVAVFAR